jgi:hypothetical protein
MNHAKLTRGVGIVPQGNFDLNRTVFAPNQCAKDKISANIVQCGDGAGEYALLQRSEKNNHLKTNSYTNPP